MGNLIIIIMGSFIINMEDVSRTRGDSTYRRLQLSSWRLHIVAAWSPQLSSSSIAWKLSTSSQVFSSSPSSAKLQSNYLGTLNLLHSSIYQRLVHFPLWFTHLICSEVFFVALLNLLQDSRLLLPVALPYGSDLKSFLGLRCLVVNTDFILELALF